MPSQLTDAQRTYLAAFDRCLDANHRAAASDEDEQDKTVALDALLAEAHVTPTGRPHHRYQVA